MRENIYIGLVVITALILALFIAWQQTPAEPSSREINTSRYGDSNNTYEVRSNSDGGFTLAIKRDEETENANDTTRSSDNSGDSALTPAEADLLAQEKMAHWTTWIAGFTAAGLAALVWTLILTHKANKAARDAVAATERIGEAQVRCYLSTGGLQSEFSWVERNQPSAGPTRIATGVTFALGIVNTGQSPAENVITFAPELIERPPVKEFRIGVEVPSEGFKPTEIGAGHHLLTRARSIDAQKLKDLLNGKVRLFYLAIVGWQDVFDVARGESRRKWKVFCQEISPMSDTDHTFDENYRFRYTHVPEQLIEIVNDPRVCEPNSEKSA